MREARVKMTGILAVIESGDGVSEAAEAAAALATLASGSEVHSLPCKSSDFLISRLKLRHPQQGSVMDRGKVMQLESVLRDLSCIRLDNWIFLLPRNREMLGLDLANRSFTSTSKTSVEKPTKVNCYH